MGSITATLVKDRYTFLITSCSVLLRMRDFSFICTEKYKTHNFFQEILSRKMFCLWENVKEHRTNWQATDKKEPMAVTCLPKKGCNHTLRLCNIYLFSTIKMVVRKQQFITLHVPSKQQKSSGIKVCKFRKGSEVTYSCHHNFVVLLSQYLCINAVSLSSIHYNQSQPPPPIY
jgi:hypothetical protein